MRLLKDSVYLIILLHLKIICAKRYNLPKLVYFLEKNDNNYDVIPQIADQQLSTFLPFYDKRTFNGDDSKENTQSNAIKKYLVYGYGNGNDLYLFPKKIAVANYANTEKASDFSKSYKLVKTVLPHGVPVNIAPQQYYPLFRHHRHLLKDKESKRQNSKKYVNKFVELITKISDAPKENSHEEFQSKKNKNINKYLEKGEKYNVNPSNDEIKHIFSKLHEKNRNAHLVDDYFDYFNDVRLLDEDYDSVENYGINSVYNDRKISKILSQNGPVFLDGNSLHKSLLKLESSPKNIMIVQQKALEPKINYVVVDENDFLKLLQRQGDGTVEKKHEEQKTEEKKQEETKTEDTKPNVNKPEDTKGKGENNEVPKYGKHKKMSRRPPWLGSVNYNDWTYYKPFQVYQDDCPGDQVRISGVCSRVPPHRRYEYQF